MITYLVKDPMWANKPKLSYTSNISIVHSNKYHSNNQKLNIKISTNVTSEMLKGDYFQDQ